MRKSNVILAIMVVLAVFFTADLSSAQNLITNGSFELDPAGTSFPDNEGAYSMSAWRFFAVGDATGSAVVSTAAATDGAVGIELSRGYAEGGDSALDKDCDGGREIIPKAQRVYKAMVDAKNGSLGTSSLALAMQFQTTSMNRGKGYDPSDDFETIGLSALSDNLGSISIRMDIPASDSSVYLDDVQLYDVTYSGNRVINGGFENSASQFLNWRYYSLNAGELLVTLDADAHTGSRAARIERTNDFETNDAALDLWDDKVAVVPGEFVESSYWVKKVSGDDALRVGTKIVQFDQNQGFLREAYWYNNSPVTTEYRHYNQIVGLATDTYFVSLTFVVSNSSGSDRHIGAYLLDDVALNHTDNIVSNNSFETLPADYVIESFGVADGWRFFAVGEALGSATARTAAASDGKVGIELVRQYAEGGDSALDRDWPGVSRIQLPPDDRPYNAFVDAKDGGVFTGSDLFYFTSQILGGEGTIQDDLQIDPGEEFQTMGVRASSGTNGSGSIRMDFRAGNAERSAFLDNVRMYDVTRMDRMLNGGFENSSTSLLNWRHFSVNAGEFTAEISTDKNSGKYAARLERLVEGEGCSDGGIDINDEKIIVKGGETLTVRYSAKKISGAEDVRPKLSIAQFDSNQAYLGGEFEHTLLAFNPGTSAYESFTYVFTAEANARYINLGFRISDGSNAQRIGAYLIDDVQIIRNQAPAFTEAAISPAAPENGDILIITTAGWTDGDNDGEGYLYQWKKNGTVIAGATNPKLTALSYAADDTLTCVVTAFDGIEQGNSIETAPVTITPLSVTDWAQY